MVLKKDSLFFVSKSWDNNIRAYFTPFYIVESNRMHPYFQEKKKPAEVKQPLKDVVVLKEGCLSLCQRVGILM